MQKFKSSSISTFIFTFTFFVISIIPAFLLLLFLINPYDIRRLLYIIPSIMYLLLIVYAISGLVGLISSVFKKNNLFLNSNSLTYFDSKVYFDDVKEIELVILSSKNDASFCSSLKLYSENELLLEIINPTIWSILTIKRNCYTSKFSIHNFFNLIIWMIVFIIFVLVLYIIGIR